MNNPDARLSSMSKSMKLKFDKYWGNLKSTNLLLYIVVVLYPRLKVNYLRFWFRRLITDEVVGNELLKLVHDELTKMYKWFVSNAASSSGKGVSAVTTTSAGDSSSSDENENLDNLEAEFKRQMELESLSDRRKLSLRSTFHLLVWLELKILTFLVWWNLNYYKYPSVSQMAKQVMDAPMSTVAAELCFSTRERILDAFRSSLSPQTVESLICTYNWHRGATRKHGNAAVAAEASAMEVSIDYIATIEDLGIDLSNVVIE